MHKAYIISIHHMTTRGHHHYHLPLISKIVMTVIQTVHCNVKINSNNQNKIQIK